MTAVVKTKLLFLDSDSVAQNDGIGSSFQIQVPSGQITAGDGQFLRVSLQNFSMLKNFYNVNEHNNAWVVTSKNNVGPANEKVIAAKRQNYAKYFDIVQSIGDINTDIGIPTDPPTVDPNANLVAYLNTYQPVGIWSLDDTDIQPGSTINSLSTSDRIMSLTVRCDTPHNLVAGDLVIQCRNHDTVTEALYQKNFSDSYELFGGRRITDNTDLTTSSFKIDFDPDNEGAAAAKAISITGYYPMQLFTQTHVFMRCLEASSNYASFHFNSAASANTLAIDNTPVFAKMLIDNQTVSYDASQHQDYFFDYYGDNLTNLTLELRDCDGRHIPKVYPSQTRDGNLTFTLVLRIDTVAFGRTGFDKLEGPMDNIMDISSDVRRTLITQGKPMWRNIPGRPGLNGQFFPKQPQAPPQTGNHPEFPSV